MHTLTHTRGQVDDVKMTMEDNVQQMLRQHEKLEDLEDKVRPHSALSLRTPHLASELPTWPTLTPQIDLR